TVYGIVKQNGGNICVYSELGKGATFKIYLPLVSVPAEQPASPHPAVENLRMGTETLLLGEDDDAVRAVANKALVRHGYTVLAVGSPQEALVAATAHAGPIHLML